MLANEYRKFKIVDQSWRNLMLQIEQTDGLIWHFGDWERLFREFGKNEEKLDDIKRELQDYLETKRRAFPKFYFLSDTELMGLLAQSQSPSKIQAQIINQCFPGVSKLILSKDLEILGVECPLGEKLLFRKQFDTQKITEKQKRRKSLWNVGQVTHGALSGNASKQTEKKEQ